MSHSSQNHEEMDMDTNTDAPRSDGTVNNGLTPVDELRKPYDASRDPRTGRPPNPLEAQRLARQHELERHEQAQTPEEEMSSDENDAASGGTDSVDENGNSDEDGQVSPLSQEQAPARMTSPDGGEEEKAAVDALVQEGITREHAEELVDANGTDWETLKAAAWPENMETGDLSTDER
jgi:hypothetical protein